MTFVANLNLESEIYVDYVKIMVKKYLQESNPLIRKYNKTDCIRDLMKVVKNTIEKDGMVKNILEMRGVKIDNAGRVEQIKERRSI